MAEQSEFVKNCIARRAKAAGTSESAPSVSRPAKKTAAKKTAAAKKSK
ncbi:hypothetical protein [Nocardioides sp. Soil796]|nr:hypothetical protein [Nocardioides sp. Soil796]